MFTTSPPTAELSDAWIEGDPTEETTVVVSGTASVTVGAEAAEVPAGHERDPIG
jgi:hypothetical protein